MRIVLRFDKSRRIHFRRKLSFQYLEGSAVCKVEKHFRRSKTARPGPSWTGIVAPYQFSAQISSSMMQSQHVDLNWLAEIGNRCCYAPMFHHFDKLAFG